MNYENNREEKPSEILHSLVKMPRNLKVMKSYTIYPDTVSIM